MKCARIDCDNEVVINIHPKIYCSKRCGSIVRNRRYFSSDKGRACKRDYRELNRDTILAKLYASRRTPHGKELRHRSGLRYNRSDNGLASRARSLAKRRERSTDPLLFQSRVEQLHTIREPCTLCGTSYKKSHSVDHVLALCNGGVDEWSNYQPLCYRCHRIKTNLDVSLFMERLWHDRRLFENSRLNI